MKPEIIIYLVIGTPIAALAIGVATALFRHHQQFRKPLDPHQRGERLGLELLLAQTLVPALQFIADLNTTVTHSPGPLLGSCLLFLAIAALVLFLFSAVLLLIHARGPRRVFLPLLSLLAFLFSVILVLTLLATP